MYRAYITKITRVTVNVPCCLTSDDSHSIICCLDGINKYSSVCCAIAYVCHAQDYEYVCHCGIDYRSQLVYWKYEYIKDMLMYLRVIYVGDEPLILSKILWRNPDMYRIHRNTCTQSRNTELPVVESVLDWRCNVDSGAKIYNHTLFGVVWWFHGARYHRNHPVVWPYSHVLAYLAWFVFCIILEYIEISCNLVSPIKTTVT